MFDFEYQAATVPRVIKYMRKQSFMGERGTRGGAKNIGVVIIDSNSPDLEATALEAQKARETSDIELFVVAVGKEVSDAEKKAIASLPHDHHILTASNYDDLPRLVSTLKERIDDLCNGKWNFPKFHQLYLRSKICNWARKSCVRHATRHK